MLLVMVIEGKHLKIGAFSALCCIKKGKGRLCQKINVHDSVNKLQYFPKNSLGGWKQPHQFYVTLFFESNAICVGIHTNTSQPLLEATCQPMLLNLQVCHVGVPFSPLDTECFWGAHDMASFLLAKKNMPQYHESHKWKIGVKFVRMYLHICVLKVIGIGSARVSLLGNRQPLNFCFGALKLVLSTSALSMATVDAFEGRKILSNILIIS